MKKLEIKTNKPTLCHAIIYINSRYDWGLKWKSEEDKNLFKKEVAEKLTIGDFRVTGEGIVDSQILTSESDSNQMIRCFPNEIEYVGSPEKFTELKGIVQRGECSSMSFLGVVGYQPVYDMTKEDITKTINSNRKTIRDNFKEYISTHPGTDKEDAVDNVFDTIRFLNTYDKSYSVLWGTDEVGYKKTSAIFDRMVKDKEIVLDNDGKAFVAEKKQSLRPVRKKQEKDVDMGLFAE